MRRSSTVLKALLDDPAFVADALSLEKVRSQTGGVVACCPCSDHDDSNPSCSIRNVDAVLLWKCQGCGEKGDVFGLIAAANDLDVRKDFPKVLELADEIASGKATDSRPLRSRHPASPPLYPPAEQVAGLLRCLLVPQDDEEVAGWCELRKLDPEALEDLRLAGALPPKTLLPPWANRRGSWWYSRHRLIVPTFDATGVARSVRARLVIPSKEPKELSPTGFSTRGLVLANGHAVKMLRGEDSPRDVVIVEGTPDFLTRSIISFRLPVVGIIGGVGLPDDVAAKVPGGARVVMRFDDDKAGEEYFARARALLSPRCTVFKGGSK